MNLCKREVAHNNFLWEFSHGISMGAKLLLIHMLQAHIERALHGHFLFRKLTDTQCHVLLDCMQRVEVLPGEEVVRQVSLFLVSSFSLEQNFYRVL